MTASILPQDRTARRVTKALGICDRQECELLDNGLWRVRDTQTGSGRWHIADATSCDCYDSTKGTCKHQIAVRTEEQELAQYCESWNARSEQQRLTTEQPAYTGQTVPLNANEYAGPYGNDGWPEPRPCCPDCGADLVSQSYHVGGKGLTAFLICSRDIEHRALPA